MCRCTWAWQWFWRWWWRGRWWGAGFGGGEDEAKKKQSEGRPLRRQDEKARTTRRNGVSGKCNHTDLMGSQSRRIDEERIWWVGIWWERRWADGVHGGGSVVSADQMGTDRIGRDCGAAGAVQLGV